MMPRFTMSVFGSGHNAREVEASALNRASALSGWQGGLRIAQPYELQQVPQRTGSGRYDAEISQAAMHGHTVWAAIVVAAGLDRSGDGIDLNRVLAGGLAAIEQWDEAPAMSEDEHHAGHEVTEALATIHATLRDGGELPDAWKQAKR